MKTVLTWRVCLKGGEYHVGENHIKIVFRRMVPGGKKIYFVKHRKIVKSLIQPKDKSMAGACNTTGDEINRHGAISVYFTLVVLANDANTNNSLNTKVASPKIPKPRRYSRGSAKPNTVCDAVLFY